MCSSYLELGTAGRGGEHRRALRLGRMIRVEPAARQSRQFLHDIDIDIQLEWQRLTGTPNTRTRTFNFLMIQLIYLSRMTRLEERVGLVVEAVERDAVDLRQLARLHVEDGRSRGGRRSLLVVGEQARR